MSNNQPVQNASQSSIEVGSDRITTNVKSNDGLVDQSQQLIDQVNQLLGNNAAPVSPVSPAEAPVPQMADLETPVAVDPAHPVAPAVAPALASEEDANSSNHSDLHHSDLLKSYLSSLSETSDESFSESGVSAEEPEAAVLNAAEKSETTSEEVAGDFGANTVGNYFSNSETTGVGSSSVIEANSEVSEAIREDSVPEVAVGQPHQPESISDYGGPVSTATIEEVPTAQEQENAPAAEPQAPSLPENLFATDEAQVDRTDQVVEEPASEVSDDHSAVEAEDASVAKVSAMEKYLEELRNSFADAPQAKATESTNIAEENVVEEPVAEEAVAEENFVGEPVVEELAVEEPIAANSLVGDSVSAEPTVEVTPPETSETSDQSQNSDYLDEDDDDEISVESWLAKNVSDYSSKTDKDSSEAEAAEAKPTEAEAETEEPKQEEVIAEPSPLDGIEAVFSNLDSAVEDAIGSDEANGLEAVAAETETETKATADSGLQPKVTGSVEDRVAGLETLVANKLQAVEKRVSGMLEVISAQIDSFANGNYVAPVFETLDDQVEEEAPKEAAPVAEPTTVDGLKEQLTAKLREAEIEMSINRAKLSQQRASLEQMQADLERREADLEAKLAQAKTSKPVPAHNEKKRGMMDRWKRHLGENEG